MAQLHNATSQLLSVTVLHSFGGHRSTSRAPIASEYAPVIMRLFTPSAIIWLLGALLCRSSLAHRDSGRLKLPAARRDVLQEPASDALSKPVRVAVMTSHFFGQYERVVPCNFEVGSCVQISLRAGSQARGQQHTAACEGKRRTEPQPVRTEEAHKWTPTHFCSVMLPGRCHMRVHPHARTPSKTNMHVHRASPSTASSTIHQQGLHRLMQMRCGITYLGLAA